MSHRNVIEFRHPSRKSGSTGRDVSEVEVLRLGADFIVAFAHVLELDAAAGLSFHRFSVASQRSESLKRCVEVLTTPSLSEEERCVAQDELGAHFRWFEDMECVLLDQRGPDEVDARTTVDLIVRASATGHQSDAILAVRSLAWHVDSASWRSARWSLDEAMPYLAPAVLRAVT